MRGFTMECDKCGAEVPETAGACPECGEPVQAAAEPPAGAPEPSETQVPAPLTDEPADAEPAGEKPGAIDRKAATIALVALVLVAVVAAVAFLVPFGGSTLVGRLTDTNDPKAVAQRMLDAYSKYDAKGILATSNSASLPSGSVSQFESEASKAKERAGGKDAVKNVKVVSFTVDKSDPNKGTVEVSGDWLTDPAKGTYEPRTDKLPMVQQNGAWVIQLF